MKFAFAVLVSAALLTAGPQAQKADAPASAAPVKRLEIPAGAVEREPNRFFFTDAAGKKWIYLRSPFGVTRVEDKLGSAPDTGRSVDQLLDVKVTEEGDLVKFERPGAFGVRKWQKKRSELDDQEKAALRRAQEASAKQDK